MFPGPTLQAAMTRVIEGAINRALLLDPVGRRALLEALTGTVQFHITAPLALTLTLQRRNDAVAVGSTPVTDAALEFAGPPLAFAALAAGDHQVFAQGRLAVTGDAGQAHQFQRALDRLQPDWESALAHHIGDVPAHFLGQRIRAAVRWSRHASATLNANIEEYIHEESSHLPGRAELEATFEDIDRLNLQTERLQARIEQLEQRPNSPDPQTSESL
ncbi:ubiquinone biosynthesis accessory factor UbiJ [Marinobacter caseinilyticus]|uniref:ubiquinone biosynthesis accessory factor UbiJ n=1 Tax=Marinobacter caseinilyticus TaxID=2692195 RepID=UPI0014084B99|nr:SCP2 sterol-binding domain-containing protein [Marinobacter caseinilyticus]